MGRGRARVAVAGAVLGALALMVDGCGAQSHANDPRPQVAIRVSVSITTKAVSVQPGVIGVGPARNQQIPQNQNHSQPPIRTRGPLIVVFVSANQTRFNSRLEIHGPKDATSGPLLANSPATFQTSLPTGRYTISAPGTGARPGRIVIGPYRASSKNDVLLP
jgi:hypothetical protein